MSYQLNEITIRTNNTKEESERIDELWRDIINGSLPILFDSDHRFQKGISPISKYHNYDRYNASNESQAYDLSIIGVKSDFFKDLEKAVSAGVYKKYDEADDDLVICTKTAWEKVYEDQRSGAIKRAFSKDYESTVPAEYTKDGKCHCYLYIAVE